MAEPEIQIEIKDGILSISIPLSGNDNSEAKAKMIAYGALKLAEEQVSIFYMQRAMKRRMATGLIKPGMA